MAERELTAAAWRGYRTQEFPANAWAVDGDVLRAMAGGTRVDLISRDSFADFTLSFGWRLPRGGLTRVLCRVDEAAGAAANSGPALQLLDDEHHPEGADALTSCGALYGLLAPWRDQRSSANTYHTARIVMHGTLLEFWIDDHQMVGCDLASLELTDRIAHSRFRELPGFARRSDGHIVLQHCGTEAWYRRLRIEDA
jgi:Domain of Unknown Function (DUF1080)